MQKEIKLKTFLIVLAILVVLEVLIMLAFIPLIRHSEEKKGQEKYCDIAICTEDKTSCYASKLDNDNNTKIIWRGRCDNYKK